MFSEIAEPTNCPSCDSILFKVGDQLFCKNISCSAQLQAKIVHFCKTLSIKGLGPKTVEKLDIANALELYYLDLEILKPVLGEKTSLKLLEEINKSLNSSVANIIEAFSIPLIGKVASVKLAEQISNINEITPETAKKAGLGDKAIQNLMLWMETEWKELKEFSPFKFENKESDVNTDNLKTVCITGKLKNYDKKESVREELLENGYHLVDTVTKTLDILVDEEDGNSSKRQKAEKYNIKIVKDLKDLLRKKLKNE
jgi:DNA ligase (NAD+)